MTADAKAGGNDFYFLKQIQIVIKPGVYPLLCQFLMKPIIVITPVCAFVRTSAEVMTFKGFQREGREAPNEFIQFERLYVLVCQI